MQKLHQRNWISCFQKTHTVSSNFAKVLCKFAKITNVICSASSKTKGKKILTQNFLCEEAKFSSSLIFMRKTKNRNQKTKQKLSVDYWLWIDFLKVKLLTFSSNLYHCFKKEQTLYIIYFDLNPSTIHKKKYVRWSSVGLNPNTANFDLFNFKKPKSQIIIF